MNKELLLKEIRFSTSRSSGPGGQHVNKAETRVELHWSPSNSQAFSEEEKSLLIKRLANRISGEGEVILTSQRYRSQVRNREDAVSRFLDLVQWLSRPEKKRVTTKPTRRSIEKRLREKRERSERKQLRGRPNRD